MHGRRFHDLKESLLQHVFIQKGLMKPARVWHIDEKTGKRTLLEDNTEFYRSQENGVTKSTPSTAKKTTTRPQRKRKVTA
jgi:hypothetical protein